MSNYTQTLEVGRKCIGYRQITDLSSAVGCPLLSGSAVMFQAEDQDVRYRFDGVDPTATVGFVVAAGECVWYVGDLSKIRFFEVAAAAILNVHVFE